MTDEELVRLAAFILDITINDESRWERGQELAKMVQTRLTGPIKCPIDQIDGLRDRLRQQLQVIVLRSDALKGTDAKAISDAAWNMNSTLDEFVTNQRGKINETTR